MSTLKKTGLKVHHKKLATIYHKRISHAKPHKRKNCLPWQPQWYVELHNFVANKSWTIQPNASGDFKIDHSPVILALPFLTEDDAQEWCDHINDMRNEWAAKERKLNSCMPTFNPYPKSSGGLWYSQQ